MWLFRDAPDAPRYVFDGSDVHAACEDIDLRDELWTQIERGVQRSWFIRRSSELDLPWFVARAARLLASPDSAGDRGLRADLVRSCNELRTPESSRLLVQELLSETQEGTVASYAGKGLSAEGMRTLRQELAAAHRPTQVLRHVIRALGCSRDHASIPLLRDIARQDHGILRASALEALASIGGLRSFEVLDQLLGNADDAASRGLIYKALGDMREPLSRDRLMDVLAGYRLDDPACLPVLQAIMKNPISKDSDIVVDILLHSPLPAAREYAAWALQHSTPSKGVSAALAAAAQREEETAEVRHGALVALRRHARASDIDWLAAYVRDASAPVAWRAAALEAILAAGLRCRESSFATRLATLTNRIVREVLASDDEDLKLAAAQFGHSLGEDACPLLLGVCRDQSQPTSVREAACQSLGKLRYSGAVESLVEMQRFPPPARVAAAAAAALTEIDPLALLGEATPAAERALADFSLRTGCLVYQNAIADSRGRPLEGSPPVTEVLFDAPAQIGTRPESDQPHVFVSYLRENKAAVDQICAALGAHGIHIWLDRDRLKPGQRWKSAIRAAIQEGGYFIACFSSEYAERERAFMNEELTVAIEELRQRPTEQAWFIPVRLSECPIPDRPIGAGETLRDIQWVDLFPNWEAGIARLLTSIRSAIARPSRPAVASIEPVPVPSPIAASPGQAGTPGSPVRPAALDEFAGQAWFDAPIPAAKEADPAEREALANDIDLVIMTATDIERNAVLKLLKPLRPRRKVLRMHLGPETYFIGTFGAFTSVVTKCRMGTRQPGSAILATSDAERHWRPRAIIMVGIAFGKEEGKQSIADVLVATQIID